MCQPSQYLCQKCDQEEHKPLTQIVKENNEFDMNNIKENHERTYICEE